ncbi:MAG: hypothetical protein ABI588_00060 [Arenimonas sp.]
MEYRIELSGTLPAEEALSALLETEDVAATADLDPAKGIWRVNTTLASRDLLDLLGRAGCEVTPAQVTLVPSVCCGGCSG